MPEAINALLSGAKTVNRNVGEDNRGNKPARTTAAVKKVRLLSALFSSVASVGVVACVGWMMGCGSNGALLQDESMATNRPTVTTLFFI